MLGSRCCKVQCFICFHKRPHPPSCPRLFTDGRWYPSMVRTWLERGPRPWFKRFWNHCPSGDGFQLWACESLVARRRADASTISSSNGVGPLTPGFDSAFVTVEPWPRGPQMGLGMEAPSEVTKSDDAFEQYRKRMMLAYRFRPNPTNNPRRSYDGYATL